MKALTIVFTISMLTLASCSNMKPKGFNINGTYNTDFGDLTLSEADKKVTGNYTYSGQGETEVKGSIKGDLNDKVVTFSWEQTQGDQKSGGSGSFTFSSDSKSFTGSWSDTKGGTGPWNGTKK